MTYQCTVQYAMTVSFTTIFLRMFLMRSLHSLNTNRVGINWEKGMNDKGIHLTSRIGGEWHCWGKCCILTLKIIMKFIYVSFQKMNSRKLIRIKTKKTLQNNFKTALNILSCFFLKKIQNLFGRNTEFGVKLQNLTFTSEQI